MALLDELVADVITLTRRPDKVDAIKLAIKSATLAAHHLDYWARDLFESGIVFTSSEFLQTLDYKSLLPTWRNLKYFRKYDHVAMAPVLGERGLFKLITPEQVLDSYGVDQQNVTYLAGAEYNLNSDTQFQYILFGAYLDPDLTDARFSSWIASDHKYLIEHDAARRLFKSIGKDSEASGQEGLYKELLPGLYMSGVLGKGE